MKRTGLLLVTLALAAGCGEGGPGAVEGIRSDIKLQVNIPQLPVSGTTFNGLPVIGFINRHNLVSVTHMEADGVWHPGGVLGQTSNYGPAVAVHNGMLYVTWIGTDRKAHVARSGDAITWTDHQSMVEGVPELADAPVAISFNGFLNIFANVKRDLGDSRFWTIQQFNSSDGVTWLPQDQFEFAGNDHGNLYGPAAAVLNGNLLLAWENASHQYTTQRYIPGSGWSAIRTSSGDQIPSLLSAGSVVYRVARSNENVGFGNIIFSRSTDDITSTIIGSRAVNINSRPAGIVAGPRSLDYAYVSQNGELFAETFVF
jgi:hypothetical protein